jgi:hypothetical protein
MYAPEFNPSLKCYQFNKTTSLTEMGHLFPDNWVSLDQDLSSRLQTFLVSKLPSDFYLLAFPNKETRWHIDHFLQNFSFP